MEKHQLSKSTFIKGMQCEKHLYLYKHHYELQDQLSEMQKSVFGRGSDVGKLAQTLFPGGIDASPENVRDIRGGVKKTKELIAQGEKIIYEAGIIYEGVMIYADVMVRNGNGWNIYEVKSSTGISETYLWDAAVQYHVLTNTGFKINDISIVYIDNTYTRQGELDISKLFTFESVKNDVERLQQQVRKNIIRFKEVIERTEMPDIDIGEHCTNPYKCSFYNYCWKKIPANSIFEISNMHLRTKFELYREGIIKIEDIPDGYTLSKNHKMQIDGFLNDTAIIDKESIKEFLEGINYPIYFMDFESFQPAVPLYNNSKPYQQIPFQYSIHLLEREGGGLTHFEFLADPDKDTRQPFIKNLLKDLAADGTILVYNKAFEVSRLREIARDFPQYTPEIESVIGRIYDLMVPFQKKYYYKPEMRGSYSIKYVLPALKPELSYLGMEIGDGGTASISFERLLYTEDMFEQQKIRENLLSYCKLDTFAMVEIYRELRNVVKEL